MVPPLLLVVSIGLGMPVLALAMLILVAPLLRVLFGDVLDSPPEWTEGIATMLELLPLLCAAAYFAAIIFVAWGLRGLPLPASDLAWFGGSLWAAFIFASCVAHELVHRTTIVSKTMGRVLSGVIGYPLLEHEHQAHHTRSGSVEMAEWPRVDESLWPFTVRRFGLVFRTAWDGDVMMAARRGHRLAGGLPVAVGAMLGTAAIFAWAAGLAGFLLYACVVAAVAWTLQAVTYIQHWGLGSDHVPNAATANLGWEDRCQLQAWLTLSISYHQAHHRAATVPYYRQQPTHGSPRAPAGYIVLLFASLVPPIWRALMLPALERWQRTPHAQRAPGRRLICIGR